MFTGQWADLPLGELAAKAGEWGFDGLELACWGDHFEVDRALADATYLRAKRSLLDGHGLGCWTLGAHLVGQALCDRLDDRHRRVLPPEIWGDGEPGGVHDRAAARLMDTARAAAAFGVTQVTGFVGSPIWHLLYSWPPNDFDEISRGYELVAERLTPVLDVFEEQGVRFALEVHPTEIAYDFVTTRRLLDALDGHRAFGINLDPSHFVHQLLDPARFAIQFADRIQHVHVKDVRLNLGGTASILGSHLDFGDRRRGWDFVSPGHGAVDFDALIRALNEIGYAGPLSIEWEDAGMDREWGARDALAFARRADFPPSDVSFDAPMRREPK